MRHGIDNYVAWIPEANRTPFDGASLLDCPPPDPTRRAAESIDLGTRFSPAQVRWAAGHDWFDHDTHDGVLIVIDRYSYNGQSYEDRIVWGGTFAELRNWAGY